MIQRRTPLKRTPLKRTFAALERVDWKSVMELARKPIPKKRSKPRRGPLRDPGYLSYLKKHGICFCGKFGCVPCHGPVNGMRSKGPDSGAIPMDMEHHIEQHAIGWPAFEAKHRINRVEIAKEWWESYQTSKGAK